MSIFSAPFIVKPGWGLVEEDLEKIIKLENLTDLGKDFLNQTKTLIERFGSLANTRIIAFDENSGANFESKAFFKTLLSYDRTVFYYPVMSNKECCVIFIHNPKGVQMLKTNQHILAHEFAHHFQIAHAGFPQYVSKSPGGSWIPPFAQGCEIGPTTGTATVDNLPLPDFYGVIKDCIERTQDIICEGFLREKGLTEGFLDWYKKDMKHPRDPALAIPNFLRTPNMKRYVRRLSLRDSAEWGATVQLAYRKNNLTQILLEARKNATKLNKKHINARYVFDEVFKLCFNTDFHLFKSREETINYTNKILSLLNIKIKTNEKW